MRRPTRRRGRRFTLVSLFIALAAVVFGAGPVPAADGGPWWEPTARPAPDSQINVTGAPFTGTDAQGKVRGFVDAHNHLMSNEGFGGRMICGKPFSDAGVADALKDCPEHYPDGSGALFEHVTGGDNGTHDPVGWPTFKDWPANDSMSHQQDYYAWIERAWRGGQRVLVNDLVTNGLICSLLPRDRGCDEMDAIRLEAQKSYAMQDFVDKMYGGPGKGWFRIVLNSAQARSVIEQGKLAVVLGVETSEPFGCKQILDVAQCSQADIDKGLDELYGLGVRSMFLCHKFDNALCGVRFDSGTTGVAVNVGQFLSTGTFWSTEQCAGPQKDNPIGLVAPPAILEKLPPGVNIPLYTSDAQCNSRGLTRLGEYAVKGMMKRGMMLELDHMSVKAAGRALDMLEAEEYPGVISSHSWMDPAWTERVYRLGGFVAGYMNGADGFVGEATQNAALRKKYGVGLGYGTDFNGVGSHPGPVGANAPNAVKYPFQSVDGGSVIDRQVTGERTWDLNTDGGAHVGLVPDWIEQIRLTPGGQDVVNDLTHGAESYLTTWKATEKHELGVNLAAGRPASASTTEWNPFFNYSAGRAVDGDTGTRWASWWSDDQWIQVDLGALHPVGRVTLDWERAYARAYRVELSDDGTNWRTAWSTTTGDGGYDTAEFASQQARYVRVHCLTRGTQWGYSLYEMSVGRS
ncbi:discoidin domain-containing protein [Yinghuangia seranimata]|uniref:discoidin domain-containing protein n=1 Tax=Yinghuangia seranimata TaxID=408067 RepID=UPI00248B796E|nr:discoidin domain-containing protein [Yinghuangia seranimata]MDI2130038.1 discoidin domain-containing protein [Yinghuangia seranimata]